MTDQTIQEILKEMGYHDGSDRCELCQHFECKTNQCDINAFYVPVSKTGWCKHGTFIHRDESLMSDWRKA